MKQKLITGAVSFFLTALTAVVILTCFHISAAAQTATQGFGVSPIIVEASARSGATFTHKYQVTNGTKMRLRVKCSVQDLQYGPGVRAASVPPLPLNSATDWLRFTQAELIVEPMSTGTIQADVSVPPSASGTYYTMPVFEVESAPGGEGVSAIARDNILFRFQGLILLTATDAL